MDSAGVYLKVEHIPDGFSMMVADLEHEHAYQLQDGMILNLPVPNSSQGLTLNVSLVKIVDAAGADFEAVGKPRFSAADLGEVVHDIELAASGLYNVDHFSDWLIGQGHTVKVSDQGHTSVDGLHSVPGNKAASLLNRLVGQFMAMYCDENGNVK